MMTANHQRYDVTRGTDPPSKKIRMLARACVRVPRSIVARDRAWARSAMADRVLTLTDECPRSPRVVHEPCRGAFTSRTAAAQSVLNGSLVCRSVFLSTARRAVFGG